MITYLRPCTDSRVKINYGRIYIYMYIYIVRGDDLELRVYFVGSKYSMLGRNISDTAESRIDMVKVLW